MPERWDPRHTKPHDPRRAPRERDKSRFAPKPKPVRQPFGEGVAILYGWHTVAAVADDGDPVRLKPFARGRQIEDDLGS